MNLAKAKLLVSGLQLAAEFCHANRLAQPGVSVVDPAAWRFPSTCAYYRQDVITICPDRCAHIGTAGRAWSYPGYVIDRTPHGVVAHELGHHVDFTRSDAKGAYGGDFSTAMRKATGEPKLTNYCPNDWEWFAEIFRLFVTNSDLLRAVRPRAHAAIVDAGYRPVVDRPWRDVLAGAPPRAIDMAGKKAVLL